MATKAELEALVIDKIDITGRKLTTGVKVRQLMDEVIDSLFDQFPQRYVQSSVNLVSGVDYTITIPSADYPGSTISNIDIWDASGVKLDASVYVQRGTSGDDKTVTLNSAKTQTNLEVNILISP